MTFAKILKERRAQSSIEYLVLFAAIAAVTLLCVSSALPVFKTKFGQDSDGKVVHGSFFDRVMEGME